MEVCSPTSSTGSRRRGGDQEEAARGRGGDMRARVCARVRTPQGVGALLLVGGAIVGAAVVAWRRRGDRKSAKNRHRDKEEEVLDGGVVENDQGKLDTSDENLSREDTEVEANGLDGDKIEELHVIQAKVDEIVADELGSEPAEKIDLNSSRECTEFIDDRDRGDIKKADQISSTSGVDNEITPNATEDAENSDKSTLTISSPWIAHEEHNRHDEVTASTQITPTTPMMAHEEHNRHGDDADEVTASTQVTPTTPMMAHQPQISEELKADDITETSTLYDVYKHKEQKPPAQEVVTPVHSPAYSSLPSLLKPAQKKRPVDTGQSETGMKLGQDCGNRELSKGGAAQGAAMVTMNRRAASMSILAIIFAVTIAVNVVVRLYSTLRAT